MALPVRAAPPGLYEYSLLVSTNGTRPLRLYIQSTLASPKRDSISQSFIETIAVMWILMCWLCAKEQRFRLKGELGRNGYLESRSFDPCCHRPPQK